MAKLVVLVYADITISDEIIATPPYNRIAEINSEIEAIISDGCTEEGFSYERLLRTVGDDFSDNVYELTED